MRFPACAGDPACPDDPADLRRQPVRVGPACRGDPHRRPARGGPVARACRAFGVRARRPRLEWPPQVALCRRVPAPCPTLLAGRPDRRSGGSRLAKASLGSRPPDRRGAAARAPRWQERRPARRGARRRSALPLALHGRTALQRPPPRAARLMRRQPRRRRRRLRRSSSRPAPSRRLLRPPRRDAGGLHLPMRLVRRGRGRRRAPRRRHPRPLRAGLWPRLRRRLGQRSGAGKPHLERSRLGRAPGEEGRCRRGGVSSWLS